MIPAGKNNKALKAALTLRAEVRSKLPAFASIAQAAEKHPGVKLPNWMAFHIFEFTKWADGTSAVSTRAVMNGGELAYDAAAFLLLGLRAEEEWAQGPHNKTKVAYQMCIKLEKPTGGFAAWLDCETGKMLLKIDPSTAEL